MDPIWGIFVEDFVFFKKAIMLSNFERHFWGTSLEGDEKTLIQSFHLNIRPSKSVIKTIVLKGEIPRKCPGKHLTV